MVGQQLKYYLMAFGFFMFGLVLFMKSGESDAKMWNAIALGGLMVFFWLFELLPIYITALFPFIFANPLKVLDNSQLAAAYGHTTIFLFFGGFILALALEKHDVHKQIAKRIIAILGKSKPRILLGFILSTALLSMWISNTATTLMMLPMALAVIAAMPKKQRKSKFSLFLLLSIAYSASVGGMATIIGSPPNGAMQSILSSNYNIDVSFAQWLQIGMPLSYLMQFALFGFFYLMLGKERKEDIEVEFEREKWTRPQIRVLIIFLFVVVLWSFKSLIVSYLGFKYEDFGPAILGGLLLFVVQSNDKKTLLDWKDTKHLPWGILMLFGGGLAMAKMFEVNGVITEVSAKFNDFTSYGILIIMLVLVTIAIFGTELMSNLALVTVFTPVIAEFAKNSDYSILQLCVPVTLAASCAFMLPVGTPPNAIVFSSGEIHINQMARYGFLLNIIAILIIVSLASLFL